MRRLVVAAVAAVVAAGLGGGPAVADGPLVIEAELLAGRARATQGSVAPQDMRRFGPGWSGDAQLSWVPPTAGHQLTLLLPVPRAGDYDLAVTYTRAANHADFQVHAGGGRLGDVQRGWAPTAGTSGRVALGRVRLVAGPNPVVVTGTGKDARSVGFVGGLHRFDLAPAPTVVPGRTEPPPPRATPPKALPPVRRAAPPALRLPPRDLATLVRPWTRAVPGWRRPARDVSPTLEIETRAASGTEFPATYGNDLLLDPEGSGVLERTFRLTNRLRGAARAVWQVCAFEPAPMAKGWQAPAGLVAEGDVQPLPAADTRGLFAIDFREFYTPPARQDERGLPRAGSRFALEGAPAVGPRDRVSRAGSRPVVEQWFGSLERVFWVRVACLDARGSLLAFPSNAVRVRFGPVPPVRIDPSALGGTAPAPAWLEQDRARLRILEYAPIRWEAADAHKRWVVSAPHPAASLLGPWPFGPKGTKLYLTDEPEDRDLLEQIVGAFEDLVTFFVDAVNWVSKAYGTIKSEAVGALASLVPGCDPTCRNLLAAGLDIGLAACGLPPDIPDFDALVALGKGHLTDVLVQEALAQGLPSAAEPLVREAAQRLLDEVERRARDVAERGPGGTSSVRPDPDFQYRPAHLRLELVNPGTQVLRPRLRVMVAGGKPWGWVFKQVNQNLPPIQPGERKEIPVFLEHDPWYWDAKYVHEHGGAHSSSGAHDLWWSAYTGPCRLVVSVQALVTNPADGTEGIGFSTDVVEQAADRAYRAR